ncbi:MAG: VOC family protein [Flavobacteriales bacterium]|nr:VOC family protein [Flavobacteriales bacterium]
MATVNVYLTFDGNCKEAFDFYKSVFGGDFQSVNTFGEMPPQEGRPPLPEEMKKRLMHISLPISKETSIMGSDIMPGMGPDLNVGNNFSLSVHPSSKGEADKIFQALAQGGQVNMPMEETFWNAYFGMLTDKFGINWMVNYELQKETVTSNN